MVQVFEKFEFKFELNLNYILIKTNPFGPRVYKKVFTGDTLGRHKVVESINNIEQLK